MVRAQTVTVLRQCCEIERMASRQLDEIRVSLLLGIKVIVRLYFELPLTCSSRNQAVEYQCGQVNQI